MAVRKQIPHDRYLQAIRTELVYKAPLFAGRRAVSIYLGGGTPSPLTTDEWELDEFRPRIARSALDQHVPSIRRQIRRTGSSSSSTNSTRW